MLLLICKSLLELVTSFDVQDGPRGISRLRCCGFSFRFLVMLGEVSSMWVNDDCTASRTEGPPDASSNLKTAFVELCGRIRTRQLARSS